MSIISPYSSYNRSYTSARDEPAADLPPSSPRNPVERCISSPGYTKRTIPMTAKV